MIFQIGQKEWNERGIFLRIVGDVINKWPCMIEQADYSGWTPLHIAVHLGNDEIIKLILEKRSPVHMLRTKKAYLLFTLRPWKAILV